MEKTDTISLCFIRVGILTTISGEGGVLARLQLVTGFPEGQGILNGINGNNLSNCVPACY